MDLLWLRTCTIDLLDADKDGVQDHYCADPVREWMNQVQINSLVYAEWVKPKL